MGLYLAFFIIFFSSLTANDAGRVLFLAQNGMYQEAAKLYRESKPSGKLLEEFSLSILHRGIRSSSPETILLTLFGASVSLNDKANPLIELAFRESNPQIQMAALNLIAKNRSDTSQHILNQAMGSPIPLIRLEAALLLAQKKAPNAGSKIESMMHQFDSSVTFLFPQIFALIGDKSALYQLRKFLAHPDELVRSETLLAIAKNGYDELLKDVRRSLKHADGTKEAAIYTLGVFKDEASLKEIEKAAESPNEFVKISALNALLKMKRREYLPHLIDLASKKNPFAIFILGDFEGGENTLAELQKDDDKNVRINACYALLKRKDPRALASLSEILLKDSRDLSFTKQSSPSRTLISLKAIPSARQNLKDVPLAFETSLKIREDALQQTIGFPDKEFLRAVKMVFENQQTDLIPLAIEMLINKRNDEVVQFLKDEEQRIGNPYIRASCCLALFRLREEGNYADKLKKWILEEASLDLVKFRPFLPWEEKKSSLNYELTPNDKAALFVEALGAFVQYDEDKGIDIMIEMLENGCGKNCYVIAGLLLRASQ